MGDFFDLHRHDQHSFFDGFGKPLELAKIAKSLGMDALGTSNHGNLVGLVQHWLACKEVGIKPILGTEAYFVPKFKKESRKSYHLCLFAKSLEGYRNLCHLMTEANTEKYYYKPLVDLEMLKRYSEGLICTSACVAGCIPQAILNDEIDQAGRMVEKFKAIFGNDFYIEIQPYKIDDKGTQERVNIELIKLAYDHHVRCILTSDSHYGKKEDFSTYCKMHEIGKTGLDVRRTYRDRYIPSEKEIIQRFARMHGSDFATPGNMAKSMIRNLKLLKDSVDDDILSGCTLDLPKIGGLDSYKELIRLTREGLKRRGKYNHEYVDRCKEEIEVIHYHGFDDYFLIVQDYVNYARDNGIEVGTGRGSACNCLVAFALGITDVDSVKYKLDFSRFMRKEKKKLPDIDVDFETSRRQEVIDYVVKKYEGKAIQICSYGEYNIDNLVNDLTKVCGLPTSGKDVDQFEKEENKKTIAAVKSYIREHEDEGKLNMQSLTEDPRYNNYNVLYDDIMKHFTKLYGKIRQLGTHAAGVAVVGSDISDYTSVIKGRDGFSSCYDLNDLEHINCTKFDMLGLKTLSEIKEMRELSGHRVTEEDRDEKEIYNSFREGKTDGVFQMEKSKPKKILGMMNCDSINDVIAVNALNRPAPLQLKMHETYAKNKLSGEVDTSSPFYKYTEETYGTILYQEQTVEIAQKLGHLSAEQSFSMLKIMKKPENLNKPEYVPAIEQMRKDFFIGCREEGLTEEQTIEIWGSMLIYGFNKGHSTGYALIAVDQMWYKIHYPAFFWYVKIKYALTDADVAKYSELAVKDGVVVMPPHVNYTAKTSIRKFQGEYVIQQGLCTVKDIGEKTAEYIENERKQNGLYLDYDDFYDRCIGRSVNVRNIATLKDMGAIDLDWNHYMKRVVRYNSILYGR